MLTANSEANMGEWTGIFDSLMNEEYHQAPGASFSTIKDFALAATPEHFQAGLQKDRKSTAEQDFGTAVHCAALEPEEFEKRYCVTPTLEDHPHVVRTLDDIRSKAEALGVKVPTKANKTDALAIVKAADASILTWDELLAQVTANRMVLSQADFDAVRKIRDKLSRHSIAKELLRGGKAEHSAFWIDPETGLLCKCRPDYLREDIDVIVDVKTMGKPATMKNWEKALDDYKYGWQSAWYLGGLTSLTGRRYRHFIHIVIESNAPHGIRVLELDDGSLEKSADELRGYLNAYATCFRSGTWPGYPEEIEASALPHWMF